MKYALVCLFSLISVTLQAAPGDTSDLPANGGLGSNDVSPKYGVISGDDENADRLLKIPEVQNIYKECQVPENRNSGEDLQTCLWRKVSDDKAIKEKVLKEYDSMQIGDKDPDKKIYEGRNYSNVKNLNIGQKPGTAGDDASLSPKQKLEKYLFQKYLEALYGKKTGEKKLMMDHTLFYKMYKSQLGKNLISSISAFAFDSIPAPIDAVNEKNEIVQSSVCLIPKKDKLPKVREQNLKRLENQQPKKDKDGNVIENSSEAYLNWEKCFSQIETLCYNASSLIAKVTAKDKDFITNNQIDEDETKRRACLTYRYAKDVRQALINVDEVEEKLKKFEDPNAVNAFQSNKEVTDIDDMDKLMAVSSKEMVEESGLDDAYKARAEELKKCEESGDANSDVCKRYLVDNPEAKEKLLSEFALRSGSQLSRIQDDLNNDKDNKNLEKYLKEEGRTEEQIQAILAQNQTKLDQLRYEIKNKHEQERKQLLSSLGKNLSERSLDKDANEGQIKGKFQEIKKEFDNRPDYLKQVVFFNNVVSSFISIEQKGSKAPNMKNTAALERELKNSSFGDNRAPAGSSGPTLPNVDIAKIQEISPKDGGAKRSDGAALDVNTINSNIITVPTPDPNNP